MKYIYDLKKPIRKEHNQYTIEELENLTTLQLREVCRKEKIVIVSEKRLNRQHIIEKILKYRGKQGIHRIQKQDAKIFQHIREKLSKHLWVESVRDYDVHLPTKIILYKNIDADIADQICISGTSIKEGYAFLLDKDFQICGLLRICSFQNTLYLTYNYGFLSQDLKVGEKQNYSIGFLDSISSNILFDLCKGTALSGAIKLKCNIKHIQILEIKQATSSDQILTIDFGSYASSLGAFTNIHNQLTHEVSLQKVKFYSQDNFSTTIPTVIGIKNCKDMDDIQYDFGYQAIQTFRRKYFKHSFRLFIHLKRWINAYEELENVIDLHGNTASIPRKAILRDFFLYLIHQAEIQHKCFYKRLYIVFPMKHRIQFLKMFQAILPDYQIEVNHILDEGSAVLYEPMMRQVRNQTYKDSEAYKALILDCGREGINLTHCTYSLNHSRVTTHMYLESQYINEDRQFGGDSITYRIFQYLKILLTNYYLNRSFTRIPQLLDCENVYRAIDETSKQDVYRVFEQYYENCEEIIPTKFGELSKEDPKLYKQVQSNFYFLWFLAENLKRYFYENDTVYTVNLENLPFYQVDNNKIVGEKSWRLNVIINGKLMRYDLFPNFYITRYEFDYLIAGDIYYVVKKFIEPLYVTGEIHTFHYVRLAGQSCSISLFKDALKEFIPGKMIASSRKRTENKILRHTVLEGAAQFQFDQKMGKISAELVRKPPFIPYILTAFSHDDKEKQLIGGHKGLTSQVYGYISRTIDTTYVHMQLKSYENVWLYTYCIPTEINTFQKSNYKELHEIFHQKIPQDDIDNILDNELKLFVYVVEDFWGFYTVPIARKDGELFLGEQIYHAFENEEWEMNFFDGFK